MCVLLKFSFHKIMDGIQLNGNELQLMFTKKKYQNQIL